MTILATSSAKARTTIALHCFASWILIDVRILGPLLMHWLTEDLLSLLRNAAGQRCPTATEE